MDGEDIAAMFLIAQSDVLFMAVLPALRSGVGTTYNKFSFT